MRPFLLMVLASLMFAGGAHGEGTSRPAPWVEDADAFKQGTREHLSFDDAGRLVFAAGGQHDGVFTSAVIDAGGTETLRLVVWIVSSNSNPHTALSVRASDEALSEDTSSAPWIAVRNGQVEGLPSGRYFQYRLTIKAGAPATTVKEVFLDTRPVSAPEQRPTWDSLVMSMMYQTTLEKLHALYGTLDFNASERGAYILRNEVGKPITPETYRYESRSEEMYLAARFGTALVMRFHPGATFSPLTLRPSDVIMRSKDGRQKAGPFAQHRAINFFDDAFMAEYLTGIRAAVRFYKQNNPRVIGYNLAPPEFFYDAEPWPAMTYLGGFSDLAKARYFEFLSALGIKTDVWPAMSDGDISRDPNYYLWVYWRHWEASRYLARIAREIREEDPEAEIGALNYVADFGLRGVEPAFLEINPDFTFYYSSNSYPRIPGADGLTGGTILSYTRPNVLGGSVKHNVAEFDLWSPYVDLKRAETYARYAQLEHVHPYPIVFGDFIQGSPPSNHLTKYHGMKGEPITLDIIGHQGNLTRETKPLQSGKKMGQVAVVIPGFSLYGLLEKDRWKTHRITQLQTHLLGELLKRGVSFDLLSEGQLTKELLDGYSLVIYQNVTAYPWMVEALNTTRANVLALGWAGSIRAPGPRRLEVGFTPASFDLAFSDVWPAADGRPASGRAVLPTQGRVIESGTTFVFSKDEHPLLRGLNGRTLAYAGKGRAAQGLPYMADLQGVPLARDAAGRVVFAVQEKDGRRVVHFGGLLNHVGVDGADRALFTDAEAGMFFDNVLDYFAVEHFEGLGDLRVMRTSAHVLFENTATTDFRGTLPRPKHPAFDWFNAVPAGEVTIPALGSVVWPIPATANDEAVARP